MLGASEGLVASNQGPRVAVDRSLQEASPEILLVPGGQGTRALGKDEAMLAQLRRLAQPDGKFITSGGVAAGIDRTLALIAKLTSPEDGGETSAKP